MEENKNIENTQNNDNLVTSNEQVKEPTRNEILREMSKEYGVNMFDAEGIKKFKDWQDSQKTELQKVNEELESLRNTNKELTSQIEMNETKLTAAKLNIKDDLLNDAQILAKNYDGDLNKVIEKYPHFVNKPDVEIQVGTQNQEKQTSSGRSAVLEAFYKKRGK